MGVCGGPLWSEAKSWLSLPWNRSHQRDAGLSLTDYFRGFRCITSPPSPGYTNAPTMLFSLQHPTCCETKLLEEPCLDFIPVTGRHSASKRLIFREEIR